VSGAQGAYYSRRALTNDAPAAFRPSRRLITPVQHEDRYALLSDAEAGLLCSACLHQWYEQWYGIATLITGVCRAMGKRLIPEPLGAPPRPQGVLPMPQELRFKESPTSPEPAMPRLMRPFGATILRESDQVMENHCSKRGRAWHHHSLLHAKLLGT
jgi:hypothetical protein